MSFKGIYYYFKMNVYITGALTYIPSPLAVIRLTGRRDKVLKSRMTNGQIIMMNGRITNVKKEYKLAIM